MALCLINGVTLCDLPYGSHKNVYGATVMYGKLDKSFDMGPSCEIRVNAISVQYSMVHHTLYPF